MQTRRGFFGSLAGLVAVVAWPWKWESRRLPVLYGDGVHDDTEAFEAWLNGGNAIWSDGSPVGDDMHGKTLLLARTIHVVNSASLRRIQNCHLYFVGTGAELCVIRFHRS